MSEYLIEFMEAQMRASADETMARINASECNQADTCMTDANCPLISGCRIAEGSGEAVHAP